MIHITRPSQPPAILASGNTLGATETQNAIAFYCNPIWDNKTSYKYNVYKDTAVKAELLGLFHLKCAYCESYYAAVEPVDIEHWRPKAAYADDKGKTIKPGYYWLASAWDNLLPSCIDCNRRRMQLDGVTGVNKSAGKGVLFPVDDETNRWTRHDANNTEVPLLLDPCRDNPEAFLEIDDEGVVQLVPQSGTLNYKRAEATKDVYGLNRSNLVSIRKRHALALRWILQDLEEILDWWEASNTDEERQRLARKVIRGMDNLALSISNECEYLLMKRRLHMDFMRRNLHRIELVLS